MIDPLLLSAFLFEVDEEENNPAVFGYLPVRVSGPIVAFQA